MRILHIMQCANLGGMEQSTLLRIQMLMSAGHHCRLVSLNEIGPLGPKLQESKIPTQAVCYSGRWGWKSIPAMRRAYKTDASDAIMMTGHNAAAILSLAGLGGRGRLLCIHYHHVGVKSPGAWRLIYRLAMRAFPIVTFASDFIRNEAETLYPPLRHVSRTLPNPFFLLPLPTSEQRLAARRALGVPAHAPVVGNAGWLIPRKRWDVFLQTARVILDSEPETVFLIAGGGPQKDELMNLAVELRIHRSVRWLDWCDDLRDFYASLDVLLFNSDWDALGRTPLEAGATGVPVVASVIHGGLKEIISGDEYGFLLDRHDPDLLAARVLLLLTDRDRARRIALACRERLSELSDPMKDRDSILSYLRGDAG